MLRQSWGNRRICRDALTLKGYAKNAPGRERHVGRALSTPISQTCRWHSKKAHGRPLGSNDALPLFLALEAEKSTIRERLREWEAAKAPETDYESQQPVELNAVANNFSNAVPHSGLTERREIEPEMVDETPTSPNDGHHHDDEAVGMHSVWAKPGTLIELRQSSSRAPTLAVMLGSYHSNYYFFTDGGQLMVSEGVKPIKALFSSANFADPSEMQPLTDYIVSHTGNLSDPELLLRHQPEAQVGAALRQKLKQLRSQADLIYHKGFHFFCKLEDKIPHETETRVLTLDQIVQEVKNTGKVDDFLAGEHKVPVGFLYAVHMALLQTESGAFQNVNSHIDGSFRNDVYVVKSANSIRRIYDIRNQIRTIMLALGQPLQFRKSSEPDDPRYANLEVWKFVIKACRLVRASRQLRRPTKHATLEPFSDRYQAVWAQELDGGWTEMDNAILELMEDWLAIRPEQESLLNAVGSAILRLTNQYNDMDLFNNSTAFTFLKEVGRIPSWESPARYQVRMPRVTPVPGGGYRRAEMEVVEKEGKGTRGKAFQQDWAADRRRDWTGSTAYAIDSASTMIIDDAISLSSTDKAGEYWVHVHVADPTSFIRPHSRLADVLSALPENLYIPGFWTAMFPGSLSDNPYDLWGLETGKPCLTVSSRLDEAGTLLDYKIEAGTLGELVHLDTDQLLEALPSDRDRDQPPALRIAAEPKLSVGGTLKETSEFQPQKKRVMQTLQELTADDREKLLTLSQLLAARDRIRTANSIAAPSLGGWDVKVGFEGGVSNAPVHVDDRSMWSGDPSIHISAETSMVDNVVSRAMLLAGQSAAKWCHDRRIPIPFFAQPLAQKNESQVRALADKLKALADDGFTPPLSLFKEYMAATGRATLSVDAQPCVTLGLDMYVKVTSPLRRFVDCIAHWQIHGALAEEARTGASLAGTDCSNADFLPWSRKALGDTVARLSPTLRLTRLHSASSRRAWISQALFRAWKYGKANLLPPRILFTVTTKYMSGVGGSLDLFGKWAHIAMEDLGETALLHEVRVGDIFEVKIIDMDVFHGTIKVAPHRRLSPAEALDIMRQRHGPAWAENEWLKQTFGPGAQLSDVLANNVDGNEARETMSATG